VLLSLIGLTPITDAMPAIYSSATRTRNPSPITPEMYATLYQQYPWNEAIAAEDRNEDILDTFRDKLTVEVASDILPPVLTDSSAPGKLRLRNEEGYLFLASVHEEPPPQPKVDASYDGSPGVGMVDLTDEENIMSHLEGVCSYYGQEYWMYEICFRYNIVKC